MISAIQTPKVSKKSTSSRWNFKEEKNRPPTSALEAGNGSDGGTPSSGLPPFAPKPGAKIFPTSTEISDENGQWLRLAQNARNCLVRFRTSKRKGLESQIWVLMVNTPFSATGMPARVPGIFKTIRSLKKRRNWPWSLVLKKRTNQGETRLCQNAFRNKNSAKKVWISFFVDLFETQMKRRIEWHCFFQPIPERENQKQEQLLMLKKGCYCERSRASVGIWATKHDSTKIESHQESPASSFRGNDDYSVGYSTSLAISSSKY